jgi:hypothetical protein
MSKKDGGNCCSNNTIVIAMSSLRFAIVFGSTTLLHNFQNTWFKRILPSYNLWPSNVACTKAICLAPYHESHVTSFL